MLLIPPEEVDVELGPNEQVVDMCRFFGGHGTSSQSHPIMWAHPDHCHSDPVLVNPTDYRQP